MKACARIPAGEEAVLPHVLVEDQGEQHGDKEPGEPAPLNEMCALQKSNAVPRERLSSISRLPRPFSLGLTVSGPPAADITSRHTVLHMELHNAS